MKSELIEHLAQLNIKQQAKVLVYVKSIIEGQERLDLLIDPAIQQMIPNAFICMVNRVGGEVVLPGTEIDSTGDYLMYMEGVDDNTALKFIIRKKS